MSKVTIEFFHDAVCGWCYVLSPRLRKLAQRADVEIKQRSFVLQRNDEEMIQRFGSLAGAKSEILNHWVACQQKADDPTAFNIEGMRAKPFSYPSGYLAALGAKTAEILGNSDTHWDYFDEIQRLHLKVNDNIGERQTIIQAAQNIGLDSQKFEELLDSEQVRTAVEADISLAQQLNIRSIPTLVVNGEHVITNALTEEQLDNLFVK
ncbi:DsbA family protein [Vibrio sp. Of7-15]|uniref:DsbA family oxidoreductase n=1 Tax=Vibrio sp. Of7-15 TaxID=2724879 RepID=UPI001EF3628E|nr:DsbA family protein [Vibrio sp. Of7-15]MCG7500109.1 DsbA family protein [Vibrio sp. Of7-15]